MGREAMIRADMESVGTYAPIWDGTIKALAKAERELSRAEKTWKANGGKQVADLVSKTGMAYTAKDPYWAVVEQQRKDVLALKTQLGLTPNALARVKAKTDLDRAAGPSRLQELLDAAHDYAVEHASRLQQTVDDYVSGVLSGEEPACLEIRQACERYQRDLQNPMWELRPEEANEMIAIIETTLCHQKGEALDGTPLRGTPFRLMPYHVFVVYNVAGFYLAGTNLIRYHESFEMVPRKNVKTTFAAGLAWAFGLRYAASGSQVYEVGGSLRQAMQGFDFLRYNLTRLHLTTKDDPETGLRIVDSNDEHTISGDIGDGGYFAYGALAASADTHDSLNANIIIADELHTYKDATRYKVLRDACKAFSNWRVLGITTAGKLPHGYCAQRAEYCRKILNGTVTGAAADATFVYIAAAPMGENGEPDYLSEDVLRGCNPGWGRSIRPDDMLRDAEQARDDPQLRVEFFAKSLDVFVSDMRAWFDISEFQKSDRKYSWTLDELAKLPVKWYGGTDLSKLHDLTAGAVFGHYDGVDIIIPHCWFPRTAAAVKAREDQIPLFGWQEDGWLDLCNDAVVDHQQVVRWYVAMRDKGFAFDKIGHDKKFCREYYLAMKKARFPVKDQPQLALRKSEGLRYIEASAKRGTLYYLHAEPFEYCVQNVKGAERADDVVFYEKISPTLRIDVFDAAVFACCAYLEALEKKQKAAEWWGEQNNSQSEKRRSR